MRVLIVDDAEINHTSADQTLAGHEVVHARTKEEAIDLLNHIPTSDWISREMEKRGLEWSMEASAEVKASFLPPTFEAVLLDLFMPPGDHAGASEKTARLIPCGFPFALLAARVETVKYLLVATSANHHDGALVRLMIDEVRRAPLQINHVCAVFTEASFVDIPGATCPGCQGTGAGGPGLNCRTCRGTRTPRGKDWGGMLTKHFPQATPLP